MRDEVCKGPSCCVLRHESDVLLMLKRSEMQQSSFEKIVWIFFWPECGTMDFILKMVHNWKKQDCTSSLKLKSEFNKGIFCK